MTTRQSPKFKTLHGIVNNPVKRSLAIIVCCVLLGIAWLEAPGLLLSTWCFKCNEFQRYWKGKDSNELVEKFGRPTHAFPSSEEILRVQAFHAHGGNLAQEWYYKPEKMYFVITISDGKILAADRPDHRHLLNTLFFGEYFDTMAALPLKKAQK
jgi:hypothetical protein